MPTPPGPHAKDPIERALTLFGDLKVFRFPMFLVYDPGSYLVKGDDLRQLLAHVEPGDVLVRGFRNYLDGYFIPGFFTHVGFYVGDVDESDRARVPERGRERLSVGPGRVVHAMAEGVFTEDLLQFGRCDYLAVMRLPEAMVALDRGTWLDPRLEGDERSIAETLARGGAVDRATVVAMARTRALSLLGSDYDFYFDFDDDRALSCTEFVHCVLRSVLPFLGIAPAERRVLGLLRRRILEPDRFAAAPLERVFESASIRSAGR